VSVVDDERGRDIFDIRLYDAFESLESLYTSNEGGGTIRNEADVCLALNDG